MRFYFVCLKSAYCFCLINFMHECFSESNVPLKMNAINGRRTLWWLSYDVLKAVAASCSQHSNWWSATSMAHTTVHSFCNCSVAIRSSLCHSGTVWTWRPHDTKPQLIYQNSPDARAASLAQSKKLPLHCHQGNRKLEHASHVCHQ